MAEVWAMMEFIAISVFDLELCFVVIDLCQRLLGKQTSLRRN